MCLAFLGVMGTANTFQMFNNSLTVHTCLLKEIFNSQNHIVIIIFSLKLFYRVKKMSKAKPLLRKLDLASPQYGKGSMLQLARSLVKIIIIRIHIGKLPLRLPMRNSLQSILAITIMMKSLLLTKLSVKETLDPVIAGKSMLSLTTFITPKMCRNLSIDLKAKELLVSINHGTLMNWDNLMWNHRQSLIIILLLISIQRVKKLLNHSKILSNFKAKMTGNSNTYHIQNFQIVNRSQNSNSEITTNFL